MAPSDDRAEPDARTLAELSALADGSLDPQLVPRVREQISRSPDLSRRYERELRAVATLRSVRSDRAPARLRASVAARPERAGARRPRLIYGGALAGAVAAAVAALVLLLPGGTPGSPSVSQAAALALRGPTMAAPLARNGRLNRDVGVVYFPNWSRLGWLATGQRVDRLVNRLAVTVYYRGEGHQIAYTILDAPALPWARSTGWSLRGVELQSFSSRGRMIVTWRRNGHTCVLSGAGVSARMLSRLAVTEA